MLYFPFPENDRDSTALISTSAKFFSSLYYCNDRKTTAWLLLYLHQVHTPPPPPPTLLPMIRIIETLYCEQCSVWYMIQQSLEAARQLPKAKGSTPFRLIFPLWKIKLLMLTRVSTIWVHSSMQNYSQSHINLIEMSDF